MTALCPIRALWKTAGLKTAGAAFGLVALAAVGVAPAAAQTTVPPGAPAQQQPDQLGPDQLGKGHPPARSPHGSTSETLGQAHGVLPPPRTGDSNVIAPQNRDKTPTPEIAPPGTPGGNPDVVPK